MTSSVESKIDNDDLICPITYQIFRDPVVAGDGHTYERAAIVRWIEEHGTSPLTRQPLNINELQADDYLRNLAAQRRNSSISSNYEINLDHAVIRQQSSTISYNYSINVDQPVFMQLQQISNNTIVSIGNAENRYVSRNNYYYQHQHRWLFSMLIMAALVIALLIIYLSYSRTLPMETSIYPSLVISTYSSMLTADSQTYRHTDSIFSTDQYYEAIEVKVFMEDIYSFTSTSLLDTYGYIYKYSFDPSNQKWNLLLDNDNGGDNKQFQLTVSLWPGITYILIVTTSYTKSMGEFSIVASGPASVNFTRTIILPKKLLNVADIGINDRWIQNGVTVAGGNRQGDKLNQLQNPRGLYVDDDEIIYVADTYNDRIVEWYPGATSGQVVAGGNGQGEKMNQLDRPTDVIVDKKTGGLIICDSGNGRIVRWFRQKNMHQEILITNVGCWSITMDDRGGLYVFDSWEDRVRRWYPKRYGESAIVARNILEDGPYRQSFLQELFYYRNRPVYLSENGNTRIMKWVHNVNKGVVVNSSQNQVTDLLRMSYPQGLAVDKLGTIYVADKENHQIMRWTKEATRGSVIVGGNGKGGQPNQLRDPYGLSFDQFGNLYVIDTRNHRVQRFDIRHNT